MLVALISLFLKRIAYTRAHTHTYRLHRGNGYIGSAQLRRADRPRQARKLIVISDQKISDFRVVRDTSANIVVQRHSSKRFFHGAVCVRGTERSKPFTVNSKPARPAGLKQPFP